MNERKKCVKWCEALPIEDTGPQIDGNEIHVYIFAYNKIYYNIECEIIWIIEGSE